MKNLTEQDVKFITEEIEFYIQDSKRLLFEIGQGVVTNANNSEASINVSSMILSYNDFQRRIKEMQSTLANDLKEVETETPAPAKETETMNYPIRDQWEKHIANCGELTPENAKTEIADLNVGSLIFGTYNAGQGVVRPIAGIVTKITSKNVSYIAPYGGFGGDDYLELQELKTAKTNIQHFFQNLSTDKNKF